jgi:prophage regulatory protein
MPAAPPPFDLREDAFLREWQVLQLLNVSHSTLHRMIKRGEFPRGIKITPRIRVWPASVVHAWLQRKRIKVDGACRDSDAFASQGDENA